jgi:hypothetical protein
MNKAGGPGFEMQWHRIDEGAVAIKDIATELAIG